MCVMWKIHIGPVMEQNIYNVETREVQWDLHRMNISAKT